MTALPKTLFAPVVDPVKLNPKFEQLRTWPGAEPTRKILDEIFQEFDDPEGNFLEQFQTTGFHSRYFELYLFAYFTRSGFSVDRSLSNPDFLVKRGDVTVAVEATTVNPPTSGVLAKLGKKLSELTEEELLDYQKNELPIRFGSPLYSKLQKRYWELDHCRGIPFVIAIEAFHDEESLAISEFALSQYVYGLQQVGRWASGGKLEVDTTSISEHTVGEKTIPSNFFGQPDAEHISALVFTNSGTNAKFARMGHQYGYGCEVVDITRLGFCFNPQVDAMDPTFFSYNLDEPPLVECWGQGLVVLHNPNCLHPIPRDFFVDAVQGYIEDGVFKSDHPAWHPIASKTLIHYLGDSKKKRLPKPLSQRGCVAVAAISKREFQVVCGFAITDLNPLFEEHGWFTDETYSFLSVVIHDKIDDDWSYVILARDQFFHFRAIETKLSFRSRNRARMQLQLRIAELLSHPQRIFPQEP
ncbi:MAG: hypothetical protein AB1510_10450 [Bacillota bacterium]